MTHDASAKDGTTERQRNPGRDYSMTDQLLREGFVIVPREPTAEMANWGGALLYHGRHVDDAGADPLAAEVYRIMIDAAPEYSDMSAISQSGSAEDAPSGLERSGPGHTDLMVTPESLTPWLARDSAAKTICDFMGWPEDGPAFDDAIKLAESLGFTLLNASTASPAGSPTQALDAPDTISPCEWDGDEGREGRREDEEWP